VEFPKICLFPLLKNTLILRV